MNSGILDRGGGSPPRKFLCKANVTLTQSSFEIHQTSARHKNFLAIKPATSWIKTVVLNFLELSGAEQLQVSKLHRWELKSKVRASLRELQNANKSSHVNTLEVKGHQPCICTQICNQRSCVMSLLIICNFSEGFLCQLQQKSKYCLVIGLFLAWLLDLTHTHTQSHSARCHQRVQTGISMK